MFPTTLNLDATGLTASLAARQGLAQHAERRFRGIPTISVLVGDGAAAYRLWLEHDSSDSRALVSWSTESTLPLFETWLSVLIDRCGIAERLLLFLARHSNEDPAAIRQRIAGSTEYTLHVYWQSLALPQSFDWLELLLRQTGEGRTRGMELAPRVADWLRGRHDPTPRLFSSLLVLYTPRELPGLWIATHEIGDPQSKDELACHIAPLVATLCESIPSLPIAVSVSPDAMNAYLHTGPESHAKALFCEGRLDVRGLETAQFAESRPVTGTGKNLAVPEPPSDDARSESERFLFAQLEARLQTAGMFILNQKSEYRFGLKHLEIDLFSEAYSIAIELDGFHHFHDPDAYRRDRKKDLLLQNLGIFVLRFLSGDVVNNLEQILATIDDTINLQRSRLHGQNNRVCANEAG